jgi:5-(aminomethyl)-3-furanmethanol phosphate kinase
MSSIVTKGTMALDHAVPLAVVKVGGGLTTTPGLLPRVGEAVARAAVRHALVVLPGGGPFADQVRAFDRLHRLSADAAHWMAILGMDQYAVALSDVIPRSRLVEELAGVRLAHGEGMVPVLAPARWLRATDELPHTWDVTSDSLAAYLATLLGADTLVLVKPVSGGAELMDPWFIRTVPAGMRWTVLAAGEIERLGEVLEEQPRNGGGESTPPR